MVSPCRKKQETLNKKRILFEGLLAIMIPLQYQSNFQILKNWILLNDQIFTCDELGQNVSDCSDLPTCPTPVPSWVLFPGWVTSNCNMGNLWLLRSRDGNAGNSRGRGSGILHLKQNRYLIYIFFYLNFLCVYFFIDLFWAPFTRYLFQNWIIFFQRNFDCLWTSVQSSDTASYFKTVPDFYCNLFLVIIRNLQNCMNCNVIKR